ncbi:molecular chaperone ABC1 [Aspergillus sp. HF37]|nr:molecular chaperone ABC1 [Aspergillus sp. HF37]
MSGKRLLDAIQLFNVAGSVATKHLAVRQRQLDVFTRTSSLTKGVKRQADGLVLTAQAAAALAKRFNEPSPPYSGPKTTNFPSATQPPSSKENATQKAAENDALSSTGQNLAGSESRSPSLAPDEAKKLQRQAEFQIPASAAEHTGDGPANGLGVSKQQDVFYKPSWQTTPALSSLPRVKLPHSTGDSQGGVGQDINADVYHSPLKNREAPSEAQPAGEKEELPEEMMKDIFHSPKVARSLSNKTASDINNNWRTSRYANRGADYAKQPTKKNMESLGSSIAEDVASVPEVRKLNLGITGRRRTDKLCRRNRKYQKM